jgi:hypothetical protein
MRRRTHWAPKAGTIAVAALLTIFAALVFFTAVLPSTILGYPAGTLAVYATVVAFVILLLGVFVEGI